MEEDKNINAIVGVTEHGNAAELVTISSIGNLIDRRRVNLTSGLPTQPYHHEGAWSVGRYKDSPWAKDITLPEAIELVERVHVAAFFGAQDCLLELEQELTVTITGIAIRICPDIPETIEERIRDNQVQTMADGIMYRQALAQAAEQKGWKVYCYDRDQVFDDAKAIIGCDDIQVYLTELGKSVGTPWQSKHKLAAAAAIVASN